MRSKDWLYESLKYTPLGKDSSEQTDAVEFFVVKAEENKGGYGNQSHAQDL